MVRAEDIKPHTQVSFFLVPFPRTSLYVSPVNPQYMADLENILEIAVWSKVRFSLQNNYRPVAMPSWSLVERWCHMAGSHLSGFIAAGSENWQDNAICRAHGAGSNPAYLTYVNSSLHLNSSVLLQTVLICTLQTESRNCFQTFQMDLYPQTKKKALSCPTKSSTWLQKPSSV